MERLPIDGDVRKNNNNFRNTRIEMTALLDLVFYLQMKDSDAKKYFNNPDATAVFEKRLLDFCIPAEVAQQQQVLDFSNHLNSIQNSILSSKCAAESIKLKLQQSNKHFSTLLQLRKQGYQLCLLRQDPLLKQVVSIDLSLEETYVINLDYKKIRAHHNQDLLRKVLVNKSELHFSPFLREIMAKPLTIAYMIG